MGITDGYKHLEHFAIGMYNKRARVYDVYVDGEWARYRGMIRRNVQMSEPEEPIARTAADYVFNSIERLRRYLGHSPRNVYIYMDGKRVRNKATRRVNHVQYDETLVREAFKIFCNDMGFRVSASSQSVRASCRCILNVTAAVN